GIVVERPRQELLVRHTRAGRQRRKLDAEQDLARLERRLEQIGEERVERDAPLAESRPRDGDAVEREERDRRILRRVGVREVATERGLLADTNGRDRSERRRQRRRVRADGLRARERAVRREGAEAQASLSGPDRAP